MNPLLILLACRHGADDTGPLVVDLDQDGWPAEEDCDDSDPGVHPDAQELAGDRVDQDCDGSDVEASVDLQDGDSSWTGPPWSQLGARVVNGGDVDGDGIPDLLAYAPKDDVYSQYGDGPNEGLNSEDKVYLFEPLPGQQGALNPVATLGTWGGATGYALAGGVDLNGDGFDDVLIGDHQANALDTDPSKGGIAGGAASVFMGPLEGALGRDDADVEVDSTFRNSNFAMGIAMVLPAGDSPPVLAIGRPDADAASGVFTWYGPPGPEDREEDCDLAVIGTGGEALTGMWVGLSADMDGDGVAELIVSEPTNATHGKDAGAVFVLAAEGSGTVYLPDAALAMYGTAPGAWAGRTTLPVDLDQDGTDELLVAAPYDPTSGAYGGKVWLLRDLPGKGGELDELADVTILAEGAYAAFGVAMSGAGDLDGDGKQELAVSAPTAWTDPDPLPGAVYLFRGDLSGGLTGADAALVLQGEHPGDLAGYGVAGGFDADGDGRDDLAIGAPNNDAGGDDAGRVYLWTTLPL